MLPTGLSAGLSKKGKSIMLKNRRRKIPYISAGIIFFCIAVLAFLEIRGLREAEKTLYAPMVRLYGTREESLYEYTGTDRLPLCYQFEKTGYQVDIPSLDYQSTDSGIVAAVSDSLWLYIAEYEGDKSGINMALGELPAFFLGSAYNRNSSYIAMDQTQDGYLAGLAVEYVCAEVNLAMMGGREVSGSIAILDFAVGDKGMCIAAMTADPIRKAKDACRDQVWEIALTMRPNPEYAVQDERDDPACGDGETISMGYKIEEMAVAELNGNEAPTDRAADGLKSQYVKPAPTPEPVPDAEPTPIPEKAPTPKPVPLPESVPVPDQEPASEYGYETVNIVQPSVLDPADLNEQSFHAPLTGVAMSVTVTLGSSGNSTVTVLCPDGVVLEPASVEGCVFCFYTTAQAGTYVVVTTGYSAAGSVSVHVHCG